MNVIRVRVCDMRSVLDRYVDERTRRGPDQERFDREEYTDLLGHMARCEECQVHYASSVAEITGYSLFERIYDDLYLEIQGIVEELRAEAVMAAAVRSDASVRQ